MKKTTIIAAIVATLAAAVLTGCGGKYAKDKPVPAAVAPDTAVAVAPSRQPVDTFVLRGTVKHIKGLYSEGLILHSLSFALLPDKERLQFYKSLFERTRYDEEKKR